MARRVGMDALAMCGLGDAPRRGRHAHLCPCIGKDVAIWNLYKSKGDNTIVVNMIDLRQVLS